MSGLRHRWLRFVALACAAMMAPGAQSQDSLRLGLPSLPAQLDPHRAVTAAERLLAGELFTGLVALDAAGQLVPGIAESWTVSPDGLTYSFALRAGLEWSDGRALAAMDIVDSLKRALDPTTAAPFAAELLAIRNAEAFRLGTLRAGETIGLGAPDRRTVRIDLAVPSQRFLTVLALPVASPVPSHRLAQLREAWASPFVVVGNGPFTTAPAGDRYILKRNEKFFDAAAVKPARIALISFMTAEAAREGLRQGEIDLALGFIASPMAERASPRGLEADMEHGVYSLVVNADRPPFNQRELRHALGMAIDREGLIKALKLAATTAAYNVVPPGVANYTPYRAPYAKLAPADRRVVAGALLLDIDPRAVAPIRLAHPAGRPHAAIAEGVAKAWHELGFRVTPLARGEADHEAALLAGDFDVAVVGHRSPLGDMEGYLHAFSQIAGPSNLARYRETSYDQRLAQADVQDNADYRISHLREAEGILIEDQIPWPLFFFAAPPLARDQLTGLVVNAAGAHVLRFIAAE